MTEKIFNGARCNLSMQCVFPLKKVKNFKKTLKNFGKNLFFGILIFMIAAGGYVAAPANIAKAAVYEISLNPAVPIVDTMLTTIVLKDGVPEQGVLLQFILNNGTPILAITDSQGKAFFTPLIGGNLDIVATTMSGVQLANISVPVLAEPDNIPPVITILGANPVSVAQNSVYADAGATATDNIDATVTVSSVSTVNMAVAGAYAVTYTTTDSSGNTTTATRTVNVIAAPPAVDRIHVNPDIVILNIGDTQQFTAEARDIDNDPIVPAPFITWSMKDNDTTVGDVDSSGLFTAVAVGTVSVVASANGVTGTADITVSIPVSPDNNPPIIIVNGANPASVDVGAIYTDAGATALDDNDGNITANIQITNNVNTAVAGVYSVIYTVSDAAGNSASATRTVNVNTATPPPPPDTTAPVITILGINPASITAGSLYTDAGATALDDVDGIIAVFVTNNVNVNIVGTYTVTYTATDMTGNIASVGRTVNVVAPPDTTAPVITILGANPASITVGSVYSDAGVTVLDDVDGVLTVQTTGTVDTAVIGTYTITYTATDAAGNMTVKARMINVVVAPSALSAITVSPETATVVAGNTKTFTATTLDQFGNPITATVSWSISNTSVGTIDAQNGLFMAVSAGTTTITATSGTVSGMATVTVSNPSSSITSSGGGGGGSIAAPFNVSIVINNGREETLSNHVFLALSASNALEMKISNNPDFSGAAYELYATMKVWMLEEGEGSKTVYVKFRNNGGESQVVSDTIIKLENNLVVRIEPTSEPFVIPSGEVLGVAKFNFTKNLSRGMRSDDVFELNKRLQAEGLLAGPIDDRFTDATRRAVTTFQVRNRIEGVGVVGPKTRAKLNSSEPLSEGSGAFFVGERLLRLRDDSKVFELNSFNGTRHWLNMTADDFVKSGRRWEKVEAVSLEELEIHRSGGDIVFGAAPGRRMMRSKTDYRVFEIDERGQKHWLNMNAEDFVKSGRSFAKVEVVDAAEIGRHGMGDDMLSIHSVLYTVKDAIVNAFLKKHPDLGGVSLSKVKLEDNGSRLVVIFDDPLFQLSGGASRVIDLAGEFRAIVGRFGFKEVITLPEHVFQP